MKKLVIILAIAIMLFAILKQRTKQPATVAVGASQNAATGSPKELPETHTEQVEQITEATSEPVPTEATEEETAVQSPMKEYAEETKGAEPEGTVECIDKGDQALAEYKPQSGNQTNPFENVPPKEIVDQPVEDLIGEGKDRPGEGKHF